MSLPIKRFLFYPVRSFVVVVQLLGTSIIAMKAQRIHIQNDVFGVIAILSNNGIISCYDESLRLLWKVSIYESSLLNMSNLIVSNSALSIEQQDGIPVLYVVISYSMSRKHLIKGCKFY